MMVRGKTSTDKFNFVSLSIMFIIRQRYGKKMGAFLKICFKNIQDHQVKLKKIRGSWTTKWNVGTFKGFWGFCKTLDHIIVYAQSWTHTNVYNDTDSQLCPCSLRHMIDDGRLSIACRHVFIESRA